MTENDSEKLAILIIAPDVFRELFQLPEGVEIVSIDAPFDMRGSLEIKIRGAGWMTEPGNCIQKTTAIITRKFDESGSEICAKIDWKLP